MGEAWGDLTGPNTSTRTTCAPRARPARGRRLRATGNDRHDGIRNYDGSRSPLNYSNFGYDLVGPRGARRRRDLGGHQPAGTQGVREALRRRQSVAAAAACADRSWSTPVPVRATGVGCNSFFDSYLLQAASGVTFVDMRDNMLAADLVRFGGANQDIIWNAFAESGLGVGATGAPSDTDPTPSFASPHANNATVTLRPGGHDVRDAGAAVRR